MPKIIIDNREVEFEKGQTVIQAARAAGIDIAHFCWHPALSVSGNCRICLVEIEKLPKLAIACATPATEGMIVHTKSEKTIKAQNAVMEFLLINHPLDCPICDEAGECKLQDYAYKYSIGISRFDELKTEKDKRVPLGPHVLFDAERCISCSRCIRFCEEIAKDPELTFVERSDHVTIETFPGQELDNPYSMNVIEMCPVGALTSEHFRFRARVWDMSFTETLCPGCARGCNTIMGVRNNEVLRVEPRENLDVNDYWLCDWGRLETIKNINNEELRVRSPQIRLNDNTDGSDAMLDVSWDESVSHAVSLLKSYNKNEIFFLASPFSTMEDSYALKKFAKEIFGIEDIYYVPNIVESFGDDLLRRSDMTPNSTGLELLGIKKIDNDAIERLASGSVKLLYAVNDDVKRLAGSESFIRKIESGIQHITFYNNSSSPANVIFPQSMYAEVNGTFINFQKRIQRLRPAVSTLENERILGEFSISRLDKFGAHNDRWTHGTRFNARPAWRILAQMAKVLGHEFTFENSEEVFMELCNTISGMEGYDYEAVGMQGITVGEKPLVEAEE